MNITESEQASVSFENFGLKETIMQGLRDAGFITPSPIQQKVIPLILSGGDVIGQANTGTGKTAAFGLPAMNSIREGQGTVLLVLTPTRELCNQVSDELYRLGRHAGVRSCAVYGGAAMGPQVEWIRRGSPVIVATPGRLLDILESGRARNFAPSIVVVDEADEMLDMGFLEDLKKIFSFLPKERQTLLFSATMPEAIKKLARDILKSPVFVSVIEEQVTNKDISQFFYVVRGEHERPDALVRLIEGQGADKSIVFCRTKRDVDTLTDTLRNRGLIARGLHGDMQQSQREEVIGAFRGGKVAVLVATDVAARGLSVPDVSHVFNYHIPFDSESYIHRIGRTGRAGKKGIAITLISPNEGRDLVRIDQAVGRKIQQGTIPTLSDLRKAQVEKLLAQIDWQTPTDEARRIANQLNGEGVAKLIALLLSEKTTSGPEQIGIHDYDLMSRPSKGGSKRSFSGGGRRGPPPRNGFKRPKRTSNAWGKQKRF